MNVSLVLELLGQVFKTFQPHQLSQEPLLEALFAAEETVPGTLDIGDHLAFCGHVGRSVGQTELGLEGVEVCLQLGLLLDTWGLVLAAVLAVLLQLLLDGHEGVAGLTALQPGQSSSDPFQKLKKLLK